VNDLTSVHTIIPLPHSQSLTKALNEINGNFNNIPTDSPVPIPMKTIMKNVIKTPCRMQPRHLGKSSLIHQIQSTKDSGIKEVEEQKT
jgi:hypothetical protein